MALPRAQLDRLLLLGWSLLMALIYFVVVERFPPAGVPTWLLLVAMLALWMVGNVALALRQVRQWRRMARQAMLEPVGQATTGMAWLGMPPLHRRIGDRRVEVRTEAETASDNRRVWTIVETPLAEAPVQLRVAPEDWWDRLRGAQDLPTGDDSFDQRFRVEASDPDHVAKVLGVRIRQLLGGLEPVGILTIGTDAVHHRLPYVLLDPDVMEAHMRAVVQVANEVERVMGRRSDRWTDPFGGPTGGS